MSLRGSLRHAMRSSVLPAVAESGGGESPPYSASITGKTSNPTHGLVAQDGVELTGVITGLAGGETVVHRWFAGASQISGEDTDTFTPIIGDNVADLDLIKYSPTVDSAAIDSATVRVRHVPPVAAGGLDDVSYDVGDGDQTVDASVDFTGDDLVYSATGATVNSSTGLVTIETDEEIADVTVTVTATNSGGSASTSFDYTVEAGGVIYTSPTRYSVLGTGYRWPTVGLSNATNRFMAVEWAFGTPDYEITDPRVFCPSFWSPTSPGEVYIASGQSILIEGWAIETAPNVWTPCDGADVSGVATISDASAGAWLPRVAATLAANTMYRARMTFAVSATGVSIPRNGVQTGAGAPTIQERQEGNTSTRIARLTSTGTALNNSGGVFYTPSMCIALGGDGRPAILVLGDSIGFGANDTQTITGWGPRKTIGYVERGLDDSDGSQRLGYHMLCVPGQRPAGTNGWDVAANWAGKRAALQAVYDEYSAWPFDFVLSQHITNAVPYGADGGDLRIGMGRYFDLLASTWGKPITQIECLPATTSTDGWQTLANQTPSTGYGYPSANAGHAWNFNADIGDDGIPDATKHYRTAGKIEDSIGSWRAISADLLNDRDNFAVRPFATTLAAAYASGSVVSLTHAPEIGMALSMAQNAGGFGTARQVSAITGSGPYSVTLIGTPGTAADAGSAVVEAPGDGVHPSQLLHRDLLAAEIVAWKVRRGWD